jgi:hydrogenase maturation protease
MRTLVGGIGYRDLRDHSIGVMVSDCLQQRRWPAHVVIEDLSYNPIAVVQRLQDEAPDQRFDRVILVGATQRPGRTAGTITAFRWDGALPEDRALQAAVAEAVTGVIALDNTLMIARYFGGLPFDVIVVDIEPELHEFGDTLGPVLAPRFDEVCDLVSRLAIDNDASMSLAEASLGGGHRVPLVCP